MARYPQTALVLRRHQWDELRRNIRQTPFARNDPIISFTTGVDPEIKLLVTNQEWRQWRDAVARGVFDGL
jgi:hypothetical protein